MDRIKRSDILIIKGVFKNDFLNNKSIYANVCATDQIMDFVAVPSKFKDVSEWKKIHTNLRCWECGLSIPGYPKFIPNNPRVEKGFDVCDIKEIFCEWNCAVLYAVTRLEKIKAQDVLKSTCIFESKFTGKYRNYIPPADPKTVMKAYAGPRGLTEKQFREKNAQKDSEYRLLTYKMEHLKRRPVDIK